jgi:hypothetical protein
MNRSKHRASCMVHIRFSSGCGKVARGMGLDSLHPNVRLSCIPFYVSCYLNIFLWNTCPILSIDISTAQIYPRPKQLRGIQYISSFLKKAGDPSSLQHEIRLPASEYSIHLGFTLFGPAFKIFFGHAGSAAVYLGGLRGRNTLERINCSGNAKPSIYTWCVYLFKQIYSIIWHKHRESSGVVYGTH